MSMQVKWATKDSIQSGIDRCAKSIEKVEGVKFELEGFNLPDNRVDYLSSRLDKIAKVCSTFISERTE